MDLGPIFQAIFHRDISYLVGKHRYGSYEIIQNFISISLKLKTLRQGM